MKVLIKSLEVICYRQNYALRLLYSLVQLALSHISQCKVDCYYLIATSIISYQQPTNTRVAV
jgi:hypothetical protein